LIECGETVTEEESPRVFAAFGPQLPNEDQRARPRENRELYVPGMELVRRLDIVDPLGRVESPTLVSVRY
jgi:hypothetical protein